MVPHVAALARVPDPSAHPRGFERGVEPRLRLAQGLLLACKQRVLYPLARCDVEDHSLHAHGLAPVVVIRPSLAAGPVQRTIRPQATHLEVVLGPFPHRTPDGDVGSVSVLRMKGGQEVRVAELRTGRESEDAQAALGPDHLIAL